MDKPQDRSIKYKLKTKCSEPCGILQDTQRKVSESMLKMKLILIHEFNPKGITPSSLYISVLSSIKISSVHLKVKDILHYAYIIQFMCKTQNIHVVKTFQLLQGSSSNNNSSSKCTFDFISRTLPRLRSRVNYLHGFESTCKRPMAVTLL